MSISKKNRIENIYKELEETKGGYKFSYMLDLVSPVLDPAEKKYLLKKLPDFLSRSCNKDFKGERVYLYFSQLGICMYCGNPITLKDLFDSSASDRDHIHPRSLHGCNKLSNIVLVHRKCNVKKASIYPVPQSVQRRMRRFWKCLRREGLIEDAKYSRLTAAVHKRRKENV